MTSSENQDYLTAFSETEDFLWLTRKVFECELSQRISGIDKKISEMKSRFLDHLLLVEFPVNDREKIVKLLNEIERSVPDESEATIQKVDELTKLVRV